MSTLNDVELMKITPKDLMELSADCVKRIQAGELYNVRNEAKLRAVNTTQTYDEFKDIVDAAHLKSISKHDKANVKTKNRLWNTAAGEE